MPIPRIVKCNQEGCEVYISITSSSLSHNCRMHIGEKLNLGLTAVMIYGGVFSVLSCPNEEFNVDAEFKPLQLANMLHSKCLTAEMLLKHNDDVFRVIETGYWQELVIVKKEKI